MEPTDAIRFTVLGKSQPAGSKKAFTYRGKGGAIRAAVTDDNAKSKPWQACVASAAREAYDGPLLDGPLRVSFTFYRQRPKGHISKATGKLLPSADAYPTTKPDVLKLARGAEDALTGVIWRDDAQIIEEELCKLYGEPERCVVVIETIPAEDQA